MTGIGIVGTGISGLNLALALQQRGVPSVVYAERTADELRGGRLPNSVVRYGPTISREAALGVNHWDGVEVRAERVYFGAVGTPLSFSGPLPQGGSAVDFRILLPQLLDDFEDRGGSVVVGPVTPESVAELVNRHDLVVIASGRDKADAFFPRDPARSVHDAPQRRLYAGLWHGVDQLDPPGLSYSLSPGAGEVFQAPFLSKDGPVSVVLVDAIPDGPLAPMTELTYESDAAAFEALTMRLLHDHAPGIRERVTEAEFHLTDPLDVFQGALTPTVRRGWSEVTPGRFAVALGDAWVLNDPITGQGANLGSACAAELAALIVENDTYDERFCEEVDRRLWALAEPVCMFTNAFLAPPPPHVLGVLGEATADQRVADAFIANFADPAAMCSALASEAGAAQFLSTVRGGPG